MKPCRTRAAVVDAIMNVVARSAGRISLDEGDLEDEAILGDFGFDAGDLRIAVVDIENILALPVPSRVPDGEPQMVGGFTVGDLISYFWRHLGLHTE